MKKSCNFAPRNVGLSLRDMANGKKKLYIIAGCNGAGKTTASLSILPEVLDCQEFVKESRGQDK